MNIHLDQPPQPHLDPHKPPAHTHQSAYPGRYIDTLAEIAAAECTHTAGSLVSWEKKHFCSLLRDLAIAGRVEIILARNNTIVAKWK